MRILKLIFAPVAVILKFINTNFKALVFLLILILLFAPSGDIKQPNLARIDIKGALFDTDEILNKLEELRNDQNIKGVLLYIDSPGGALSPSVEIATQVKRLKESKKVLAYAGGSMASGSYYAGVNADKILANPSSFIGSIGVIMQAPNIAELAHKIGVSEQVVKAGEFKEAGTFTRQWSKEERASLQNLVDGAYELFTKDVAQARNLSLDKKDEWANARVFLADDALKMGLIDGVCGYFDAKSELEAMSGVDEPVWQEKPQIEKLMEKFTHQGINSLFNAFFSAQVR